MAQVIAHSPRDADLPTLNQPLEPSGDIHAVPENVVVLDHDVADIDADPKAHPSPFWLAFDRTANCIEHTREFCEHAVAGGVRDPASMPGDELVDNGTTGRQCRHRRFFVAMHQAAVALDIGCEDRDKAPFQLGCFHIQISIAQALMLLAQTTAESVVAFLLWAGKQEGAVD
jgi:hypothetical protein